MAEDVTRFYDGFAADYHLIFADWDAAIARQAEQLDRLIRAARPAACDLLDCACGIGTQALGLAARGYRVTATDLSAAALARAEAEAAARGLDIRFQVADMRELALVGAFDVALVADNALAHLEPGADLDRAAAAIAARLCPGGLVVASIRDYDALGDDRPSVTPPVFYDGPTGRRITHQVWDWLDARHYRVHQYITLAEGGGWRVRHHVGSLRALLRDELTAALEGAGLAQICWHMPPETGYYQPIVTGRAKA